jgi:AcrR family transcriptional regulator
MMSPSRSDVDIDNIILRANVAHVNIFCYKWVWRTCLWENMFCYEMPRRKPYHHGNLGESLLAAAVKLIADVGPAGFTLREVARRAGVSHNAPYRHFRDKSELLAAVAAQGFRELKDAMTEAAATESTSLGQLKRSGWAYVAFALRRPEHFAAMFDAPACDADPDCMKAGEEAFATLVGFIERCQREGQLPGGGTEHRALLAWSLVHGIAKLAVAQRLPFRTQDEVLQFAVSAIEASIPALERAL